ncbi:MAG: hypothetical protein ACJ0RA_01705 [Candidatus Neomarinimicrobiota bacterium]
MIRFVRTELITIQDIVVECTYASYIGEVDEELIEYIPAISAVLNSYMFVETGWINQPNRWPN